MRQLFIFVFLVFFSLGVSFAYAGNHDSIVPCTNDCNACHLVELGDNILDFFVEFSILVATVVFAWGGFLMVFSAGDTGKFRAGSDKMTDAVIGIFIVLSAWLLVDTVMKLVLDADFGVWNDIECADVVTAISDVSYDMGTPTLTETDINARISRTDSYNQTLCEYATQSGISDQCDTLEAIMAVESGGVPNADSGHAVGLMQMTVGTARTLDPDLFEGMSDEQARERLANPDVNMRLAVKNYANLYNENNRDEVKAIAGYNGGRGALEASQNCENMMKWQCEWDNDAHTVRNAGYEETRNYLANVTAVRAKINAR